MHKPKSVLLISLPYAGIEIPSIQLATLESYLKQRDVTVTSKHLYVDAADYYGIAHYNFLIYPPNESYTAQLFFIKHVFPDHYQKNKFEINAYFNDKISKNTVEKQYNLDYETYQQRTDCFFEYVIKNLKWSDYDIIGFSCNYGQFLPSLAVAKQIKKQDKTKHIVFGGSRVSAALGKAALQSFDYIDSIVSGEGEEALYQLCINPSNYEKIPNLIYRQGSKIKKNSAKESVDLSSSAIPLYDSFFQTLLQTSDETQQYHQFFGRLPVEISRGCWWNKCSFCNLNLQYNHYKEKASERIISEIDMLTDKYGILSIQLIGNTLPIKNLTVFLNHLQQMNKDCRFIAEARADQLNREHYEQLKEAGVNIIQTGIESFSKQYLQKMEKGVGVIENIATLKNSKEQGIENPYNLIFGYPNEERKDINETKNVVKKIKSYLDPPNLCTLRIVYKSPIYDHPNQYGIDTLTPAKIDLLFFPHDVLNKHISFVFDSPNKSIENERIWHQLIDDWKKERSQRKKQAMETKQDIDRFVFYFKDGGSFLKIFDKRNKEQIKIFILDSFERNVFLKCLCIQDYTDIKKQCVSISEEKLKETLDCFVKLGIIYEEDNRFLSLPLQYSMLKGIHKENQSLEEKTFKESIIQLKNQ